MTPNIKFELQDGETWRDVVERISNYWGMSAECLEEYDWLDGNMYDKQQAASQALYEWDCLPLEDL